jgi:ribosomal protein S18 acetylase RimI-like enzyme
MADASVRTATAADADAVAAVQAAAWSRAYAGTLPAELLEALGGTEGAHRWRSAVVAPPTPRHRVLVADAEGRVVGLAAFGPAEDPDTDPGSDAELHALSVDPAQTGRGHGSRLVNAAAEHLSADGFRAVLVWLSVLDGDDPLRRLLVGAGWEPDGARRELDLRGDGQVVLAQTRLRTTLAAGA